MKTDAAMNPAIAPVTQADIPAQVAETPAPPVRHDRKLLAFAALLLSATSIGLHFLPVIADRLEARAPLPQWLRHVETAMLNRTLRGALTSDDIARVTESAEAFKALPADAQKAFRASADMEQSVARIDALRTDLEEAHRRSSETAAAQARLAATSERTEQQVAAQASDMLALRGSLDTRFDTAFVRLDDIEKRLSATATRDDVARGLSPLEAKLAEVQKDALTARALDERLKKIEQQTADMAQSRSSRDTVQLLLGRVLSAAQSGPVDSRELDLLAQLTAQDPALTKKVSELKILAGMSVQPVYVLREQFRALQPRAMEVARNEGLSSIGSAFATVRSTLHAWGVSASHDPLVGELAIENANEALDHGDLQKALFELEAAPPQTRRFLGVWSNQAKLRVSLDRLFGALVDHLATQPEILPTKS